MKPILIRADAGGEIGTGHVMRMIALAQAYQRRGGRAIIATSTCPEAVARRITSLGIEHQALSSDQPGSPEDAAETRSLADALGISWLVLDGYHFSLPYQQNFKDAPCKLLVTDDHGYCDEWCCDALLNQNLDSNLTPTGTHQVETHQLLLGSSFCLLREEFLEKTNTPRSASPLKNILVTMGGSDPDNATQAVLDLLDQSDASPLHIRVLAGAANPHLQQLRQHISSHEIEIVVNAEDMPHQLAWANGIISAGGSTCWEWLHAGLPGAIVTLAENQVPIVRALSETRKAALALGWPRDFSTTQKLNSWLANPASVIEKDDALGIVDGHGADRVATLLHGTLKINIITATEGWIKTLLHDWCSELTELGHEVSLFDSKKSLPTGDILLVISCWELLDNATLAKHSHNLVAHGSDLPAGKGWSPVTWQILEGQHKIPVTIFEAEAQVDAGDIYHQNHFELTGRELLPEIHEKLARTTFGLCHHFITHYPMIVGTKRKQEGEESFYQRRTPSDSELDPARPLNEQINILRVADNDAYPAFFIHQGQKYILKIEHAPEAS